jgi:hypothetical protein
MAIENPNEGAIRSGEPPYRPGPRPESGSTKKPAAEARFLSRGLALLAALLNILAAVATIVSLPGNRERLNTDWEGWVYAWSVLPYGVLALISWLLGRNLSASMLGFLSTILVAILGLCAAVLAVSALQILLLPAVQLVACGVVAAFQVLCARVFGTE